MSFDPLSIEAIRTNAARQLGRFENAKTIFSRKSTRIVTLTEGEWDVVDDVLKNAQSTIGVSDGTPADPPASLAP